MCGTEGVEGLGENGPRSRCGERAGEEVVEQGPSGQAFHHDVRGTVVVAAVVDGDDVRVVQCRGEARLGLETPPGLRYRGHFRAQHLHRDRPGQALIPPVVHVGHSAAAQHLTQLVPTCENHRHRHTFTLVGAATVR